MSQSLATLAPDYTNRLPTSQLLVTQGVVSSTADVPCPPKVEIVKPCPDPCDNARGYGMNYGWGWLGALILWFIIFTVLFWLIFYSLKPAFVLQRDSNQVDTSKVLLAAVIAALIMVVIIWLIKAAVSRR